MSKTPDPDEYLDGCFPALERRRRLEPCRAPRRWVTITLAALVTWAALAGALCLGYAIAKRL